MELETWRPLPGWSAYEVSDIGRVRSLTRRSSQGHLVRGRILTSRIGPNGYRRVALFQDGKQRQEHVHALVLEAFVGPRPEGLITRHLDGDRLNNLQDNLTWGTHAENSQDMVRHGRSHQKNRTHCPKNHPLEGENLEEWHAKRGRRMCKTCRDERNRDRYQRDENGKFPPRKYKTPRFSQPRGPLLDAAEITRKYLDGAGLIPLAKEYRTSGPRIRECILSRGVQIRGRGGYPGRPKLIRNAG